MKSIPLTNNFKLEFCTQDSSNALNAFSFEALDSWAIQTDHGPRFDTRYTYSTIYAALKKTYFNCGNAKAAIQQAVILASKGQKLSTIYFKIIPA
jgi:hypothetical protein